MTRAVKALAVLAAILVCAAPAAAKTRHHAVRCHAGYVKKTVRVRRHEHHRVVWVKQTRCVKRKAAAKKPTASPTSAPIHYSTSVDPSYTQDPSNSLAVTYAYSAAAAANGTDLGPAGQLPPGVLNFYSPTSPGQPAGLVCSMNVGGAVTGGNCLVNYTQTGVYQVTTQYVPNQATAVTQTDTETISPYPSTTSTTVHYTAATWPQTGSMTAAYSVAGQGIGAITPAAGSLTTTIADLANGQSASWTVDSQAGCQWDVTTHTVAYFSATGPCAKGTAADGISFPLADFNAGQVVVTATYAGMPGWAGSTSQAVAADTP